jgi:3-oxoacyl-[acyl-carrier-protein] synthase-3
MKQAVISGSGSYIQEIIKRIWIFLGQPFFREDGVFIPTDPKIIIDKFQKITGIAERRYAAPVVWTPCAGQAVSKERVEKLNNQVKKEKQAKAERALQME